MVKIGDIVIDTKDDMDVHVKVKEINSVGIWGTVVGNPELNYSLPWNYALMYATDQDFNPIKAEDVIVDYPIKKSGYFTPTQNVAKTLFHRDRDVIAHVKKHDGTLDRAFERATLGHSPEKEWLEAATLLAEDLVCII